MEFVKVEKTVYVKDKYGVKRQVFVEGQVVDKAKYDAVVNPQPVKKLPVSTPVVVETPEPEVLPAPEEPVAEPEVVKDAVEEPEVKDEVAEKVEETEPEAVEVTEVKPAKTKKKVKEDK